MKKAVAILGILIVLAAAAAGAYYLGARSNPVDETTTAQRAASSTQPPEADDTPLNFDEMLPGLWINSPVVGSGVGECYRFYADGTYTFTPSEFIFEPERYVPPESKGTYLVEDDYVLLLMTESTAMEGGAWVEDPVLGYVLEGGTEKTVAYPEPKEIYAQYLGVFYDLPKEMFSFDGRVYWKTSADPDAYLHDDFFD